MQDIHQRFIDFVHTILSRSGMFQVNNIDDMGLVVLGFQMGCNGNVVEATALAELLASFRSFVNKHFNTDGDYDWVRVIRFHASGDYGSLELFKSVFDRFWEANYNSI